MDKQITVHLTLAEATSSNTANKFGIKNIPTEAQYARIKALAEHVIEPLYEQFTKPQIGFSSLFRSKALNEKVGGSSTSDHTANIGAAVDLHSNNTDVLTNAQLFHWIKDNLQFDQMIWEFGNSKEPSWVHVGYRGIANRKMILVAKKVNGKTAYVPYK